MTSEEIQEAIDESKPAWVTGDIDADDIRAINYGGCSSGAYMPAVTYYQARETMSEHGDDVLQYLQDQYGELPQPRDDESWSGIAVHYLSCAVECWAASLEEVVSDAD
jgi:hypothetical protein